MAEQRVRSEASESREWGAALLDKAGPQESLRRTLLPVTAWGGADSQHSISSCCPALHKPLHPQAQLALIAASSILGWQRRLPALSQVAFARLLCQAEMGGGTQLEPLPLGWLLLITWSMCSLPCTVFTCSSLTFKEQVWERAANNSWPHVKVFSQLFRVIPMG